MASLSESQQNQFTTGAARLGFGESEKSFTMSDPVFQKNEVTFGGDPSKVDIAGKVVPVASVADLKKLCGIPNHPSDDHVVYPEPLPTALKANSSEGLDTNVKVAAVAYLLGQPAKVADYEDLINHSLFPGKALVFNADDLYVKSGQTVVLGTSGETEVYNFGTITVEPGGQINVVGNTSVNSQKFIQLS